ncbi:Macrolide export protein MacA [bacterium HR40]|nr:Macrolide export protein MacA [bacterium HR40]
MRRLVALMLLVGASAQSAVAAPPLEVQPVRIADLKAVFATVEPVDRTLARSRIAGTVAELLVDEGSRVAEGQPLARVSDPKLDREKAAIEAQIRALEAQRRLAATELERARELRSRQAIPQARLDEAESAFQVVEGNLAAKRAELALLEERIAEGRVLAPRAGRILSVRVTAGTFVLPGEPVAELAVERYLLRARLPERHARFVRPGDRVRIGPRGLGPGEPVGEGRIVMVYPELEGGRVVVDIEADGLGDYFVGERARIEIEAGAREVFLLPPDYVGNRYGVDFVRLEDGREVVVQRGLTRDGRIEILAGLRAGDRLLPPETGR